MKKRTPRYKAHVFVCTRTCDTGEKSCGGGGGVAIREKLEEAVEKRGWKPRVHVSESACLGICAAGPNVMIYPQRAWYSAVRLDDVNQILADVEAMLDD